MVDDGSTEPVTRSVLESLAKDRDLLVISQEWRGVSVARNTGIAAASTDFVLCLDADDGLDASSAQVLLEALGRRHDAGFAYPSVRMFGAVSRRWRIPPFNSLALLAGNVIPYCALMRRGVWESVGGYCESVTSRYEDWDFWLSCVEQGIHGLYVPDATLWYRRGDGSALERAKREHRMVQAQVRSRHPLLYRPQRIARQAMSHPDEVPGALVRMARELIRQAGLPPLPGPRTSRVR